MDARLASHIEKVTVFRAGARVHRVAELAELAGGAVDGAGSRQRVRLVRLPLTLDDGSVRARVEGAGAAVDLRVALDVPPLDASLAPPHDEELIAAQIEVARLRAEVERVNAMLNRVASIGVIARPKGKEGEAPIASPLDARRALVAMRTEEQERLAAELLALEKALEQAEKTSAALKDRAARASTARNPKEHELFKSAIVTLEGVLGGRLHLSYMVPGARWSPAYSLSIDAPGKSAQLTMRAAIAQRSGEDWPATKIVLSTADAEKWTELPELKSVRIGRAQRAKASRGWREPPMGALELYADYDRAFGPPGMDTSTTAAALAMEEVSDEGVTSPVLLGAAEIDAKTLADDYLASMPTQVRAPEAAPVSASSPATGLPPPPRMVAAMMPAPQAARARSGGVMGAIGGALEGAFGGGAPPPTGAPPPLAAGAVFPRRAMLSSDARAASVVTREPEPPPAGLDLEALAYGRLRMLDPSLHGRGSLVAASAASLYLEALDGVGVSIDVLAVVRVAVKRASWADAALPPGHEPIARPGDFDYAYEAESPVSVPSDGAFHVVPVSTQHAEARVRHVTVPRETQDVFRVLELTSPLDAALLRGPVDVYQGDTYLMTTRFPATLPRGKVRLGLGVEQSIKVARNTSFAEKSTGLLGGGLSLAHEIDIELVNVLERQAEIEVRERIPTSREDDKDIEVIVETVEPAWKEWSQEQSLKGGYRWSLTLDPGQKRRLFAKYVVKISGKQELAGGNRREL